MLYHLSECARDLLQGRVGVDFESIALDMGMVIEYPGKKEEDP